MTKGGWVYIMTNRYNRVFYTGVTADLPARIFQHRNGEGSRFCKRYNLTKLAYVEEYPTIEEAFVREKRIKVGRRPGRSS